MKLLKIELADGKKYTFSTLSALEAINLRKEHKKNMALEDELDKIMYEVDEKGKFKKDAKGNWIEKEKLSETDEKRIEEIQQLGIDFSLSIFRKSLCKVHSEFKVSPDAQKEKQLCETMLSLVDIDFLRKIVSFAFTGHYEVEDREIIDIPLEVKPEDGK